MSCSSEEWEQDTTFWNRWYSLTGRWEVGPQTSVNYNTEKFKHVKDKSRYIYQSCKNMSDAQIKQFNNSKKS